MTYALGIDVGTSYTAAATWRPDSRQRNRAEVVPLGNRAASVASVLFLGADRSVLVGEAAQRRVLTDPDRVAREFKRRIGDDTPVFVGGEPHAAQELAARMVGWVVDRVTEREGGPPARLAITHPASWGPYKKDLLRGALGGLGLNDLTFLSEPEAAAISYASLERVEAGSTIAVYDLGGGTFDAAVVRKTDAGAFRLLGSADGLENLGGADFDEAVFSHVQAALGAQLGPTRLDALDVEDPNVLTGLARLRRECVEAKETLSSDTEVSIPVLLPGVSSYVRLGRSEFEQMIRPAIQETVDSLSRALRAAGVRSEDLSAVLLVGGSSRIPLVSQLVSDELDCPVVVDADPKTTIALGAALSMATPEDAGSVAAAPIGAPAAGAPATVLVSPVAGPGLVSPVAGPGLVSPVAGPDQDGPAGSQAPQRPPLVPAARENAARENTGLRRPDPKEAARQRNRLAALVAPRGKGVPRNKLMAGLTLTVMMVALITGALLIPTVGETLGGRAPTADGSTTLPVEGLPEGNAAGDAAKVSTNSPNASRGPVREADAVPAGTPATTAARPTPGGSGTQGGRITAAPVTAPATGSGTADPPTTDPPTTNPPSTDPPTTNPPTTNPPSTNPPTSNPPADDPPAENPPADETPAENPPADETPASDPSTGGN